MYNEKDLQLIKWDTDLIQSFNGVLKVELLELVKTWLDSPELRPQQSTTFDDYSSETKAEVVRKIVKVDWKNGLRACQIAQVRLRKLMTDTAKVWKVIRLKNEGASSNVKLGLEMDQIRDSLESFLSRYFNCYIYAHHDQEMDTYLFLLTINPKDADLSVFNKKGYIAMVYFPETEYVVTTRKALDKETDGYFKEALLDIFSATAMYISSVDARSVRHLKEVMDKKKSIGIFGQLNNNQYDTSPLDIRQKKPKGFDQTYVKPGEQRKRIVPIDMEGMKARYEAVSQNFGWSEVEGQRSLEVDLELPFDSGEKNKKTTYDDDIVEITMRIDAFNVAEGVRKSIVKGLIDVPAPLWLEGIAVTEARKIRVTTDGVLQDIDEAKAESKEAEESSNKRARTE